MEKKANYMNTNNCRDELKRVRGRDYQRLKGKRKWKQKSEPEEYE